MELRKILQREGTQSRELLKRSKALVCELEETVERSHKLLEESYRIIDRLKIRLSLKDNP